MNMDAHEGLWEQLEKLDGQQTAQRAACRYLSHPARYAITMLNVEYVVVLPERRIYRAGATPNEGSAGFLEQLCLLAYLIGARDVPPANKLVSAHALPGGQFFFRGIHALPTEKLEKAFGDCPSALPDIAAPFGAERREFGDASIQMNVLPRVSLTIVIWGRCEEFETRASVLFDRSVSAQLPLDALLAAVNLTSDALVKAAKADK